MVGKETAYIMINCEVGYEESIIEQLKTIEGVKYVQGVLGNFDILARIEVVSIDALREIITSKIRKIQKIRCTTTVICSKNGRSDEDDAC
ncbi:MAG TPA: Lrp/AsnC ligand binding domain-containing protein [Nitrosopumilaceae archaeon]|nr:Lrp/AsnC ligand binding domain-containing protein [Nitrosopumilaceae archaeon]